ncbi:MAG: lysophospholipid acyltransferase family protein [Mariprofundaceae bacterium]|nr:lysophospholipid acyltransferase family protein [Mariprofundaceae bacterium]
MLILRSALFNLCFLIITVFFSTLLIASRPFGVPAAWFWGKAWSASTLGLIRIICGIRFEIEGREHLPDTPCVVLAKHQSAFETIAMPSLVPPFVWVLKRELFYIPIFGWALWALNEIAIRRSNPRKALKQVLAQGQHFLKEKRWVVIFPEGTRTEPGQTGDYQASGIMLARKARVGILPMAHNAGVCWPKRGFIKHPGTVRVRFLPFITPEEMANTPRNELLERLKTDIEAATRKLGG